MRFVLAILCVTCLSSAAFGGNGDYYDETKACSVCRSPADVAVAKLARQRPSRPAAAVVVLPQTPYSGQQPYLVVPLQEAAPVVVRQHYWTPIRDLLFGRWRVRYLPVIPQSDSQ